MLGLLTTALTLGLIVTNLIGLALATRGLFRSYVLARVASPGVLALAAFFAEHFVGFGRLAWIWPLTTAASAWIVYRDHAVVARHWKLEAAFLASFEWVFAWRAAYPGLGGSSEKIGDLAMIVSYFPGDRLPPVDAWLPPYPFDVYYSFQHYAAALLGRIFNLPPGLAYNIAFCLLVALTITAAALFAFRVSRSVAGTSLVVLAFAAGGTGASLPVHAMMKAPQLYSSMRFIGGSALPERADTPFGQAVVRAAGVTNDTRVELPSETFAYLLSLGDYHPPLSGFYLLMLAMGCVALIETGEETRIAQAVLVATPILCTIANGWTLPLQAVLVVAWIGYRLHEKRAPDWTMLAAGFLGAAVLCYPFLSTFAYRSADYGIRFRPVSWAQHAPPLLFAILLYPVIVSAVVPMLFGERKRWILWCSALWLALLCVSELVNVDDIYAGPFNRFNTTLKWWPWIQAAALLTSGAYAMRSKSRAVRYGVGAMLVAVSAYAVDMTTVLAFGRKLDAGRLDGASWITSDNVERAILDFLKAQPRGIVLQRIAEGAFTPAPSLTLFAGQTAFMGWSEHEKLWRGQRVDIEARRRDVARFYAGEMEDSLDWLLANGIDHVLWLKTEDKQPAGALERIGTQIRSAYIWREYYRAGAFRVGVWSRVPGAGRTPLLDR